MLFHPGIVSLLIGSVVVASVTTVAFVFGLGVVIGWNPTASDDRQIRRERRAVLVETALRVVLWCELLGLFLFILIADRIHPQLKGAMCAAGSLNANQFGYPSLFAKLAGFGLCGGWLILSRPGTMAMTRALVRFKQGYLLCLWGVVCVEGWLQARFFVDLEPNILTSCCASVFSEDGGGLGAEISTLPPVVSFRAFFGLFGVTILVGLMSMIFRKSPVIFGIMSFLLGLVSVVAVVSWIGPAYYQLPAHHCPFCLLGPDLGRVGYPMLVSLAVAVVTGSGSVLVRWARGLDPSYCKGSARERGLCAVSMGSFIVFACFAVWPILGDGIRLEVL